LVSGIVTLFFCRTTKIKCVVWFVGSPIRPRPRLDPVTGMAKCTKCSREATDGFRWCLRCRQNRRRRRAREARANREAGRCLCGRLALVNYSSCKRCLLSVLYNCRGRRGFGTKCLYVAETAYGVKVVQSHVPSRRTRGLKNQTLAGLDHSVKLIKPYEEKGHLEKLVQYELAEYCVRLPNGRLSHGILSCDLVTVFAVIDRVIAEDHLGVSSAASSSA